MHEIRNLAVEGIELREHAENGPGMSFRGYAAVFNSDSEPLPFIEQVAPGAFGRSLGARNNVRMLLNHDTSKVLGATRSGTLRLSEDSTGLLVDADLPPTSYGRDLSISMTRGDVEAMSFGFSVPRGGDTWSEDGQRRTLTEVRLHEVSVVTFPAYPETTAAVRSFVALAQRCNEDADMLSIAVDALLMAEKLDAPSADLLRSVIDKMTEAPEEPTAEITIDDIPLSLLMKQMDLMAKSTPTAGM
jgi:HK97 family phage prohead protease